MAPTRRQRLQAECRGLGLATTGSIAQLIMRIKEYKESRETPMTDEEDPQSAGGEDTDEEDVNEEDPMCDAVLVTKSMFGEDSFMKVHAKLAFEAELKKGELEVEHVRGETYVGNRQGLNLAGMKALFNAHESKISLLETNDEDHKREINDLKSEIKDLKNHVNTLTTRVSVLSIAAKEYKLVRQRYISTFKRNNLLDTMEKSDYDIIRSVNQAVHEGDAEVDALLYEEGGRDDTHTFQKLYGLHPAVVSTIKHSQTLNILNLHAQVRAHKDKTGTDEFFQKFAAFIQALEKSSLNPNYLTSEPPNATRIAYLALLNCPKYKDGG